MEETTQEKIDSSASIPKTEEITDNRIHEIKKSEYRETDEISTEHVEEENNDEIHSENDQEKSNSECSDASGDETDDASVIIEREEGDGQESTPNRKVDDDEDKRNPQYIPKRGTFYEHDDRTAVDEEDEEGEVEKERLEKDGKKKVWLEKEGNKWSHDRFNDQEQAPKSRAELVAIYGYDIRNEEGPPRARRRRRYGRGPNKYTRNWEDEEAYSKPTNVSAKPVPRKPRRTKDGEEFPPLEGSAPSTGDSKTSLSPELDIQTGEDEHSENRDSAPVKHDVCDDDVVVENMDKENGISRNGHTAGRPQRGGRIAPRKEEVVQKPKEGVNVRGVTKTRGFFKNGTRTADATRTRNQKNQQKPDEEYPDYILSQNFTNKTHNHQQQGVPKLEKDMANMSMQHQEFSGPGGGPAGGRGGKFNAGNTRQTSVPPRLQAEQRGAKRYSSLRQRSLPETAANPQFGQHPQFYQGGEFPPDFPPQPTTTQPSQSVPLLHPPPATGTAVPLNGAPQLIQGAFVQGYPQHPQAPAFLPPVQGPVPQPYLPPQPPPPQILNFAPPAQPYPQTFSGFQHQQFNPVPQTPPAELYQPQGGITYYSPQNQHVIPRVQQKRVKAAIPIVPPPEHKEPRGRGRLNQGDDSPVGSGPDGYPEEHMPHDTQVIVQQ